MMQTCQCTRPTLRRDDSNDREPVSTGREYRPSTHTPATRQVFRSILPRAEYRGAALLPDWASGGRGTWKQAAELPRAGCKLMSNKSKTARQAHKFVRKSAIGG